MTDQGNALGETIGWMANY